MRSGKIETLKLRKAEEREEAGPERKYPEKRKDTQGGVTLYIIYFASYSHLEKVIFIT